MKKITFLTTLALALLVVSGLALAQGPINPKDGRPAGPTAPNRAPVLNLGPGSPFCSTPGVAIPDSDPTGVSDDLVVGASFTLTALDVSLLVTHSWVGDLAFTLSHSGGCGPVDLGNRAGYTGTGFGCSDDNIDATLDDEGTGNYEDQCNGGTPGIGPGNFVPGDPPGANLTACDGDNINGTWTLVVSDNAGGDTGILDQWCLVTTPVPVELTEFAID